jgi:hypothetical protein
MWLNITLNSGVWPKLRSGLRARTTSSNGTSWLEKASSVLVRTRERSSVKVGLPLASVRNGRVLTKRPSTPSVSIRLRPAVGAPTVDAGVILPRSAV